VRVTGSTDFGEVCAGSVPEKTISVCNVGKCNLSVLSVAFNPACSNFTLINNPFPAIVSPDSCMDVVIRYTPRSCGEHTCTLVITTDDPDTPVIILTVTASTPCASIDVPPDMAFPPTVISSFGPCRSLLPFPISNTGTCPLWITDIQLGGPQAAEYSFVGLPSFPIILEQGHIVGEGDFSIAFSPDVVARERHATITVTYISDPISGATSSVTRELCGEGVATGARVLVMQGNIPLAKVEKIQLQRINANRNKDPLDTHDVIQNATLVTVVPGAPCEPFQYHREYGTVSNPIQLLPGSYQVTVSAIVNGKRKSRTVGFDVQTCTFNPAVVIKY
jgi:HYDIN/CFA65/VesB family protein